MPLCFICYEEVKKRQAASCTRCEIHMHGNCFDAYAFSKQYTTYTKCPRCNNIGCIGIQREQQTSFREMLKSIIPKL